MSNKQLKTCAGCGNKATWDVTKLCWTCQAIYEVGLVYYNAAQAGDAEHSKEEPCQK